MRVYKDTAPHGMYSLLYRTRSEFKMKNEVKVYRPCIIDPSRLSCLRIYTIINLVSYFLFLSLVAAIWVYHRNCSNKTHITLYISKFYA